MTKKSKPVEAPVPGSVNISNCTFTVAESFTPEVGASLQALARAAEANANAITAITKLAQSNNTALRVENPREAK